MIIRIHSTLIINTDYFGGVFLQTNKETNNWSVIICYYLDKSLIWNFETRELADEFINNISEKLIRGRL